MKQVGRMPARPMEMEHIQSRISLREVEGRICKLKWNLPESTSVETSRAYFRIAAEDIYARENVPKVPISAVDGYALRSVDAIDLSEGKKEFRIVGVASADSGFKGNVGKGECCEVYTGAPLPAGCDAIVMAEDSSLHDGSISIASPIEPERNVRKVGEDISAGTKIASKGDILHPFRVTAAISSGVMKAQVYCALNGTVISTGDELMPDSENFTVNSGQGLIVEYFKTQWLHLNYGKICSDDSEEIRKAVKDALKSSEIIIITGGSSIGRRDRVPEAMAGIGDAVFSGVNMRPGRTITLYISDGKPVFSISGLPGPALTSFEAILEIFLSSVYGFNTSRLTVQARAAETTEVRSDSMNLKRVSLFESEGEVKFRTLRRSGLQSLMESDGVLEIGPGNERIERGKTYRIKLNR